jgi:hypothetical protein
MPLLILVKSVFKANAIFVTFPETPMAHNHGHFTDVIILMFMFHANYSVAIPIDVQVLNEADVSLYILQPRALTPYVQLSGRRRDLNLFGHGR